jgi:hypothetical protein
VIGSLIGVAAWSTTMFGHVLGPLALLLPSLGFFLGGAVAGTALRRTVGAAIGFGVAFMIGNVAGMLSLVATQAMTGPLLVGYVFSYSLVFSIAGLIGLAAAGVRGRPLMIGVLSFSAGGLTTAVLVVDLLNLQLIGGSPVRALLGFAIPMTLPWVIGGAAISKARDDEA